MKATPRVERALEMDCPAWPGKASSEPLYPDDPTLPGNRRIAIVLLREAPVLPPNPGL